MADRAAPRCWTPTESEKDAAVRLLADLLRVPGDEQLGVLAILANLWCYHQNVKTGRMQL